MRTYVVNLKRRRDRRERMERILPPEWAAEYTTNWPGPLDGRAIDPGSLSEFSLFPWQMESENPWWNRPLKLGEIGCAVSHWLVWNMAAASGVGRALIFEDDAVLVEGCSEKLEASLSHLSRVDPDWDLLFLGRWALEDDEPVAEGLVRPGYSYCLHGYMLSGGGLAKVLAAHFENDLIPVDEFIAAMYMEHPRADVRRRYRPCLRAYALNPDIVMQLPKEVAGSDTEMSASVGQGMHGEPLRSRTPAVR